MRQSESMKGYRQELGKIVVEEREERVGSDQVW